MQNIEQDWIFPKALAEIRTHHPHRPVIIGGSQWNSWDQLAKLRLPDDDPMLIGIFHYYLPFEFTHQGAEFMGDQRPPKGRSYPAKADEPTQIAQRFQQAADWSKSAKRPLYLGEFGSYQEAAMSDRVKWTADIVRLAEQHQFSTAYWEYCSGFGAWNPDRKEWRDGLLHSLQGVHR